MKNNMVHFKLTIQSFDFTYIKQTIGKIRQVLDFFEIRQFSTYAVPSRLKKFTVERSPHIDKKSREQFEIKRFKTNLEFRLNNTTKAQIFYYVLKNTIFPGVQISLSLNFQDYIQLHKI